MVSGSGDNQAEGVLPASAQRVLEFTQHNYLAILATVYPSGGPQAFPVWYDYDGDIFRLTTEADAAKVRNIARNPRIALCITDTTRHIRSLTVLGQAEVIRDNQAAQELHRQLSIRHLGPDEGTEWADSMSDEELVVLNIVPERFLWTG